MLYFYLGKYFNNYLKATHNFKHEGKSNSGVIQNIKDTAQC